MTKTETTPGPDAVTEIPVVNDTGQSGKPKEIGGPKEADPTRYGDWTVKGRCIDF